MKNKWINQIVIAIGIVTALVIIAYVFLYMK